MVPTLLIAPVFFGYPPDSSTSLYCTDFLRIYQFFRTTLVLLDVRLQENVGACGISNFQNNVKQNTIL